MWFVTGRVSARHHRDRIDVSKRTHRSGATPRCTNHATANIQQTHYNYIHVVSVTFLQFALFFVDYQPENITHITIRK